MFHESTDEFLFWSIIYLGIGLVIFLSETFVNFYQDYDYSFWGKIKLLTQYPIVLLVAIVVIGVFPPIGYLFLIYMIFWPIPLFFLVRKIWKIQNEKEVIELYKNEGPEKILSAGVMKVRKYKFLEKYGNEDIYETIILGAINRKSGYDQFFNYALSRTKAVVTLKQAYREDKYARENDRDRSHYRKKLVRRMRELRDIEADQFVAEVCKKGGAAEFTLGYIEDEQVLYNFRDWVISADNRYDDQGREFAVALVDEYISLLRNPTFSDKVWRFLSLN